MIKLRNFFISGLLAIAPLVLSIYLIISGFKFIENLLGQFIRVWLPEGKYITGLGFISTLGVILLIGFLIDNYITGAFLNRLQKAFTSIPLIKTIYAPLRDLMNLFAKGQEQNSLKKVALVHISPDKSIIGLVTRESFEDIQINNTLKQNRVAVYIPMSYGLGGYTILVEKSSIEPLDIPIEKAMSLALTGWITTKSEDKK